MGFVSGLTVVGLVVSYLNMLLMLAAPPGN